MMLWHKIHPAVVKAAELHRNQKRKGNGEPYIIHPFSVAFMLSRHTDDADIIAAGLLHDTVEDCGYAPEQLRMDFGERIARIVLDVSEDTTLKSEEGAVASWKARKEKYLAHLCDASSEAKMVSCADKIHNIVSLVEAHGEHGDAIFAKFNAPMGEHIWFYEAVYDAVKDHVPHGMKHEFERALVDMRGMLKK